MKRKQRKAFLGAIIGSAIGLAGSAIGGAINRNNAKKQLAAQQTNQNKKDTYEMAQNLSASYGEQGYVDEFSKKVNFRNGGKFSDRVKVAKRYKCGGKKKFGLGGWKAEDTSAIINSIGSAGSNIIGSAMTSGIDNTIKQGSIYKGTPKESIELPEYITNGIYNPRMMRTGGKYKRRSK